MSDTESDFICDECNGCCICLDRFTTSRPGTVMRCDHTFHAECILEWCETRSHCPLCERNIPSKDIIACYESEKRKSRGSEDESSKKPKKLGTSGGNVAESSRYLGALLLASAPGQLKCIKVATKPRSRRRSACSKTNASDEETKGLKGAKGCVFEDEELLYNPDWNVHTTDHPLNPLVALNLAKGMILPTMAAHVATMRTDLLHKNTDVYNVMALNYSTLSRMRDAEEKADLERELTEVKEQWDTDLGRALLAETRVIELEEALEWRDALISDLRKAEARTAAALSNMGEDARNVSEVSGLAGVCYWNCRRTSIMWKFVYIHGLLMLLESNDQKSGTVSCMV